MSDSNPNKHGSPQTPRDSLVLLTAEERAAEERRQSKAADKNAEDARKKRGLTTAEKANSLAKSNRNLMVAVVILTAATAVATWYQGWKTSRSVDLARETLGQIRADSRHSSDQFQAQIHHFDAGLGQEQILAGQAVTQAAQTTRLATDTHDLAVSAGQQAGAAKVQSQAAIDLASQPKTLAGIAQQQLNSSERPWMRVDIGPQSSITIDTRGNATVPVHINATNVGRSPALRVHAGAALIVAPGMSDPPLSQLEAAQCSQPIDPIENQVIFPGRQYDITAVITALRKDMILPSASNVTLPNGAQLIQPIPVLNVVGCLDYVIDFSGEHKQTFFLNSADSKINFNAPGKTEITLGQVRGFGNSAN